MPPKFAVVGHGLGGSVALDVFRRGGERVTRVVLIAADPLAEQTAAAADREARIVAGRLAQAMREEMPPHSLADTEWRDEVHALVQNMAFGLGEGVFIRQTRALQRRPDMQKTMCRIKVPALTVAGKADTLVPMRRQEFPADLMPFGKLLVIEGAGHLPTLEQPSTVSDAIEAFLNCPVLLR